LQAPPPLWKNSSWWWVRSPELLPTI
jgi:hypothetical protein